MENTVAPASRSPVLLLPISELPSLNKSGGDVPLFEGDLLVQCIGMKEQCHKMWYII
jgi:hypothetical protein